MVAAVGDDGDALVVVADAAHRAPEQHAVTEFAGQPLGEVHGNRGRAARGYLAQLARSRDGRLATLDSGLAIR